MIGSRPENALHVLGIVHTLSLSVWAISKAPETQVNNKCAWPQNSKLDEWNINAPFYRSIFDYPTQRNDNENTCTRAIAAWKETLEKPDKECLVVTSLFSVLDTVRYTVTGHCNVRTYCFNATYTASRTLAIPHNNTQWTLKTLNREWIIQAICLYDRGKMMSFLHLGIVTGQKFRRECPVGKILCILLPGIDYAHFHIHLTFPWYKITNPVTCNPSSFVKFLF